MQFSFLASRVQQSSLHNQKLPMKLHKRVHEQCMHAVGLKPYM